VIGISNSNTIGGLPANLSGGGGASGLVTDGLILNLDSTDSSSYSGTGTAWADISAEGNDFSLVNGPTFSTDNGGTIVTDGTNDYIQSDAGITEVNAAMSAFAYVKITNLTAHNSGGLYLTWVFNKRPTTSTSHWQIAMATSHSDWTANGYMSPTVDLWNGATTAVGTVDGNLLGTRPEIRNDEWHYIGFTTDGTSGGDINLYMDGILYGTNTLSANRGIVSKKVRGAMDGWGTSFGLVGSNRNYHIYNKKLTTEEVLQNYNAIKI
jgi:hypothetical protein